MEDVELHAAASRVAAAKPVPEYLQAASALDQVVQKVEQGLSLIRDAQAVMASADQDLQKIAAEAGEAMIKSDAEGLLQYVPRGGFVDGPRMEAFLKRLRRITSDWKSALR